MKRDETDGRTRKLIVKCDNCKKALSVHSKANFCPIDNKSKTKMIFSPLGNTIAPSRERFSKKSKFKAVYGATFANVTLTKDWENNLLVIRSPGYKVLFTFPLDPIARSMVRYDVTFAQIYFLGIPENMKQIRILKAVKRVWYGFYE